MSKEDTLPGAAQHAPVLPKTRAADPAGFVHFSAALSGPTSDTLPGAAQMEPVRREAPPAPPSAFVHFSAALTAQQSSDTLPGSAQMPPVRRNAPPIDPAAFVHFSAALPGPLQGSDTLPGSAQQVGKPGQVIYLTPEQIKTTNEQIKKLYVVISMTSVPSRNGTLGPTITSLLTQSRLPDEIRLYIGPGCDADVPGVKCIHVKDRGPVTKLSAIDDPEVPADAIVVTVDDDIVFQAGWLEMLLRYVSMYPEDAVGMAGWNLDSFVKYGAFEMAYGVGDVLEGFAGVAYRKWFFDADVLDPPEGTKFVDDVWISAYLNRMGIVRRIIPGRQLFVDVARSIPSGLHMHPQHMERHRAAVEIGFLGQQPVVNRRRGKGIK